MSLMPIISPGAAVPATIAFTERRSVPADSGGWTGGGSAAVTSPHTFTSMSLGAAAADRKILVALGTNRFAATISACTIGGVSATLVRAQSQINGGTVAFFIAAVPTGTTGDIVMTFSSTITGGVSVGVWRCTGISATATATDGEGYAAPDATNFTLDVNVLAGGVAVAASVDGNSVGTHTMVWSGGVTEDYDYQVNTYEWHSGASALQATASTPLNIVGNPDAAPHRVAAAVSFPPG